MKKVTEYDIEKIYSDMEKYLINNIIRNLTSDMHSFHLKEEEELGFKWEAWQTAKLRDLQKFRRQNKDIVNSRTKGINKKIAALLNKEAMQGKKTAYKEYKEALTYGYNSSVQVKDSFFKMSSRKVRKLIGSVTNDFQKVNQATFRRSNDIYRQIIVEASMYKNTGVMTSKQAINKAIEDFKSRGINSIVYSNGSKHKISDYASMAIRTASTRAQLMGEGELRKKMGVSTIQMSKHSTSCKLCQPWEGKVLIDDVYSGGSKKDGNYPLLSDAMKQGLYHPNCRHGHGTYFPELSKQSNEEIIKKVDLDTTEDNKYDIVQKQRTYERKIRNLKYQQQFDKKSGWNNAEEVTKNKLSILKEEYKTFLKDNNLKRYYFRESIDKNINITLDDVYKNSYNINQYKRYSKLLGNDKIGKIDNFLKIKYNHPNEWKKLMLDYSDALGIKSKGQVKHYISLIKDELRIGQQEKHIIGTLNYKDGKSYITISLDKVKELVHKYAGTGEMKFSNNTGNWTKTEKITTDEIIGVYIKKDSEGNVIDKYATKSFVVKYSKKGYHIVPAGNEMRDENE